MKKKDSNTEGSQQIYIFETPEQDRSHIATPNELILKPKASNIRRSKFQESTRQNFKKREGYGGFDPHLLKQNPMARAHGGGQEKENQEFDESQNIEVDICKTPAELAQLNKICEEIFIADDLDFEIDLQPQISPDRQEPKQENIFAPEFEVPSETKSVSNSIADQNDSTERVDEKVLWQRPPEEKLNREASLPAYQPKELQIPAEKDSPKISGLTIYRNMGNVTVEITNKLTLLLNPIPPGIILSCKLKRTRDLMNFLTPQYDFFLEKGLKHIVSAQKKILSNSQAFLISSELGNYEKARIIATLRSNVLHNEFLIMGKEQGKEVKFKFIYGGINYGKLNKDKTQRSMSVTVPVKVSVGVRTDHIRSFSFDSLSKDQQLTLYRRRSEGENSEKNFELIDEEEQEDDYNYLRLVKQSDNVFNIEVQHPLSPLQAFGVVLTRFDAQLR